VITPDAAARQLAGRPSAGPGLNGRYQLKGRTDGQPASRRAGRPSLNSRMPTRSCGCWRTWQRSTIWVTAARAPVRVRRGRCNAGAEYLGYVGRQDRSSLRQAHHSFGRVFDGLSWYRDCRGGRRSARAPGAAPITERDVEPGGYAPCRVCGRTARPGRRTVARGPAGLAPGVNRGPGSSGQPSAAAWFLPVSRWLARFNRVAWCGR
jgi:hypothetical protein